ncbi:Hpt domain-containing protein [Mariniblastus sp.]|nr:Hpt domain-containing protein [Mariniblastus sp.]
MGEKIDPADHLVDLDGALRRLGGDRQLFNEFITIFLEDSPTLLEEIRSGLGSNDSAIVEKSAHSLKGLMSNFGAKQCVELALKIELAGRAGSVDDCGSAFTGLEAAHRQLTEELKTLQS